jgi:3-methylcrotonyl-CoA carboxylase alpha subunit
LQVEHTVTEAITGLDLVEWQLRVASGEALPFTQDEIRLHGHAIEARVCAEDPDRDFLPSAGDLRLLEWPSGESIRVDAGFATGDVVPATYDSLLGKVVAWAPERSQAAARLASALERIYCVGVQTNDRWLSRVLRDARFLAVRHSIAFLQDSGSDFAGPQDIDAPVLALAALATHATTVGQVDSSAGGDIVGPSGGTRPPHPRSPWDTLDGFTPNLPARVSYNLTWRGHPQGVDLTFVREQASEVSFDGPSGSLPVSEIAISGWTIAASLGGVRRHARYLRDGAHLHIWVAGAHIELIIEDSRLKEFSATASQGGLTTPLPGVVAAVVAKLGDAVKAGDVLMVIEAMKMEHSIRAPHDGVVKVIHFRRGDRVPEGSQLLELAPAAAT